jgi:hypothetical protein
VHIASWSTYSWFPKMFLQVGHPYNAIALSIWCNNPPKPLVRSYTIMNLHFQCSGISCQFESQLLLIISTFMMKFLESMY